MPTRRRDVLIPSSPTAPMAAARMTLGSGRTRTTKPARITRAATGRQRRRSPTIRQRPIPAARMIATLEPLTADRWVMPVASIASLRSLGVFVVSPMTRPGRSPRASVGSSSVARRNRARTTSATRWTGPGGCSDAGGARGLSTARTSSPGSDGGLSRPETRTLSCHRTESHEASPRTRTGLCTADSDPRPVTDSTSSLVMTSGSPPGCPPRGGTSLGSLATVASTVTVARSAASSLTGPASRTETWAARHTRANADATPVSAPSPHRALTRSAKHARVISAGLEPVRRSTCAGGPPRVRRLEDRLLRARTTNQPTSTEDMRAADPASSQRTGAARPAATTTHAARAGTSSRMSAGAAAAGDEPPDRLSSGASAEPLRRRTEAEPVLTL